MKSTNKYFKLAQILIKLQIALALCLFGFNTLAQKITVLDEENLGYPFAHIQVYEDSTTKKLYLTDEQGVIDLKREKPTRIEIQAMGYATLDTLVKPELNYILKLQPESQTLNEVVITAQFAPNSPEKAVHNITVIDSKRIEEQGAITLEDVLSNETNIRISQDNILGSSMSMQGLSGQNVKILIDGVPVVGRLDGNIDLSQINMNNVERIEIIQGPLSVNYGSNALAGTINIIMKKDQKKKVSGTANTYYETVGQFNVGLDFGYKLKKNLLQLSLNRNAFDGWSSTPQERSFEWKPKNQLFGNLAYTHNWENTSARITLNGFNEKISNFGDPRYVGSDVNTFDEFYITNRLDGALFVEHYFEEKGKIETTTAYNYYRRNKNRYFVDLTTLDETLTSNFGDQDTSTFDVFMARGSYSNFSTAAIQYQIGYDINLERGQGVRIKDQEQYIGDFAGFANLEWTIDTNLTIRPGIRYSYNTSYASPVTPSINIRYGNKAHAFRISYAQGFRAPSIKDLYFDFVDSNHNIQGNEDLKSETSHNIQTSWTWNKNLSKKAKLKTSVDGFYNHVNDLITLTQSTSNSTLYENVNIGTSKTLGGGASAQLAVGHVKVVTGFTYTGLTDDLETTPGEKLPAFLFYPECKANFRYDFFKQKITLSLFYKYNGEKPNYFSGANGDVQRGFIAAYSTLDFSASKRLLKDNKLKITVGAKNLFDVSNITTSGATGGAHSSGGSSAPLSWGRTAFVKLSLSI